MADNHFTVVCNSTNKRPIIYPPVKGRSYLLIENRSASTIYINFGRVATSGDGIRVFANGFYEREQGVPQGELHLCGSGASDQVINITEQSR